MLFRLTSLAFLVSACLALKTSDPQLLVLPPPLKITASGPRLALSSSRIAVSGCSHPYVTLAEARFNARLPLHRIVTATSSSSPFVVTSVSVTVHDNNGDSCSAPDVLIPREKSLYNYSLTVVPSGEVRISAASVFGVVYALESLSQLTTEDGTALIHNAIDIQDAPAFVWRGVMLDTGRRFVPLPTLLNILDTMVAVKLNVLHLHASDDCRFGVESKLYPNLTAALVGHNAGFYSQEDIRAMVTAAAALGIRIVPEFDIPSHARGLRPIKSEGVQFCTAGDQESEVYNDPANATLNVLKNLFTEMAQLFPDDVMSIGGDEIDCTPLCTCDSITAMEKALIDHIEGALHKTSSGWQEVLTEAYAATKNTIVNAWWYVSPADIIALGNRVVDMNHSAFYLTRPPGPYPYAWSPMWADISAGLNATTPSSMLLGGELAMWTDFYCDPWECGSSDPPPGGSPAPGMFPPSADPYFAASLGGMLFPRSYVGASAFWGYNASLDSQSPAFVSAMWDLNDRVVAAGGLTCPTRCDCDLLSACDVPYLPSPFAQLGAVLISANCSLPLAPLQTFRLTGDGYLATPSNAQKTTFLCAALPGAQGNDDFYGNLVLAACPTADDLASSSSSSSASASWVIKFAPRSSEASDGHLVMADSLNPPDEPACLDAGGGIGQQVGTQECGGHQGYLQLNQGWALDDGAGIVLTFAGGGCLTAVNGA